MAVVSTHNVVFKHAPQARAGRTGQALATAARFLLRTVLGLLLPAALFALWQLAVKRQWLPEQILPGPDLVWMSFKDLWDSGELLGHLAISAKRVGWSLLLGGGVGLVLGFGMGLSRTVRAYLLPTFDVVSQFPVLGWIPILMIFVGIDEALKICAISIAVVVPVAVNAQKGIANIPRAWFEVARVYGFTGWQVVRRVVLPAAAPSLFTGIRQAVMQAWLTLVFVELLASSEGIGYLMVWGRQLAQLDLVVVGMVMIGLVGVVLDLLLRALEARLQRWRISAF
jgi:sulfonate transport system permease protein